MTELPVVIPFFNEEASAPAAIRAVAAALRGTNLEYEIVAVDDGSSDETAAVLRALAGEYPVRTLSLSRNFGKESALTAGLDHAVGRAVVFLDGDLQHPPEIIPILVEKWREGYAVVNAVKRDEERPGVALQHGARLFHLLYQVLCGADLRGQADFKLLDREVVDALKTCHEHHRFFRGLVDWAGFRVCEVAFSPRPRIGGGSRWSRSQLVLYSLRNLAAFSSRPLYSIAAFGIAVMLLGAALAAQTLYRYASGQALEGFTTVILVVILLCGAIIFSLGVIAVYLAQIYEEVKNRPIYVVRRETEATRSERGAGASPS